LVVTEMDGAGPPAKSADVTHWHDWHPVVLPARPGKTADQLL